MEDIKHNRLMLIMNPRSGTMQAAKFLVDILQMYSNEGYRTTVLMTSKHGDARDFAMMYGNDVDQIIVSGGDGTLNEVIDGIITAGIDVLLGYIPSGSTNDFGAGVGLPRAIMDSASIAINGNVRKLDVGSFNGRYFTYVASFGAFTSTSYNVPQNLKNLLGHTAYVLQGARDLLEIKPIHAKVIADEGTLNERILEDDYLFGAVCNSTSVAGILKLDAFDMDMNDGMMEVILVRKPQNLIELNETVMALLMNTLDASTIEFFSAKNITFDIEEGTHWTLDGEFEEGNNTIDIHTLQSAITIKVAKEDGMREDDLRLI